MDRDAGADQEVNRVMREYRIGETLGRLTVVVVGILCLGTMVIVGAIVAGWMTRIVVDAFLWGYG